MVYEITGVIAAFKTSGNFAFYVLNDTATFPLSSRFGIIANDLFISATLVAEIKSTGNHTSSVL